jgi:hypothetical protein
MAKGRSAAENSRTGEPNERAFAGEVGDCCMKYNLVVGFDVCCYIEEEVEAGSVEEVLEKLSDSINYSTAKIEWDTSDNFRILYINEEATENFYYEDIPVPLDRLAKRSKF